MGERKLASRLDRLGTETAYSVAAEARALASKGKTIYPFHIGDFDIKTPPHIIEAAKHYLDEGKTGYCDAAGIPCLREALAEEITSTRGVTYDKDEVSVQPGGKSVIGKFLQVCMEDGDEVLYPSPGYPIYESQINFLGGVAVPYAFKDTGNSIELDMDKFSKLFTPQTKVVIFNNYQNPFGYASHETELREIAALCVKHNVWVLSDEAYFDLVFDGTPKSIVAQPGMKERSVILYTFSKSFSMTGWRLGAAIGPKDVIAQINKLNSNQEACTNHFVQFAGYTALTSPLSIVHINSVRDTLLRRRNLLVEKLNEVPGFTAYTPAAAFYVMVNVTKAMEMVGVKRGDLESFRKKILGETGVSFCTREHFGAPLDGERVQYVRFAFSGVDTKVIEDATAALKTFMQNFLAPESKCFDATNSAHAKLSGAFERDGLLVSGGATV